MVRVASAPSINGAGVIAGTRTALLAAGLVAVAVAAAGCGSSRADKAGGSEQARTTLHMANPNGGTDELGPFLTEVVRRSHGAIRIEVENSWRDGRVDSETALIHDVAAGKVAMGWVGTRAWDSVGVTSLDSLHAPFLIDSYELEEAVVRAPMIRQMLRPIEKLGLVPLGVLPGPLREPLGRTPLRSPADFAGKTIGVQGSRAASMTMRAFGAAPRRIAITQPLRGLDGADQQLTSIDGNGYDADARYVTGNVRLWPRPLVVFMNRKAFDRLSAAQQRLLVDAVRNAVRPTARLLAEREAESAGNLCRRGAVFVSASAAELAELRSAVRPVYSVLERDPATNAFIGQIRTLKRAVREASVPQIGTCARGTGTTGDARSQALIAGRYTATVTRAELLGNPTFESGEDNPGNHGRYRLELRDGRWALINFSIHYTSGGTFTVDADTITLRPDTPDTTGEVFVFRWSLYRGALTLTKVSPGPTPFVVHPWIRAE
jgi:TRAP-type C4-dicarboxylate transport system substrate-binding protein